MLDIASPRFMGQNLKVLSGHSVMAILTQGEDRKNVIALKIKDKASLHSYYMPFIKGGGLFIPNLTEYELGDRASIALTLMEEADELAFTGIVVWVAKKGVKSPHKVGVGVRLDDPNNTVKDKIERYLTGSLTSTDTTFTM